MISNLGDDAKMDDEHLKSETEKKNVLLYVKKGAIVLKNSIQSYQGVK